MVSMNIGIGETYEKNLASIVNGEDPNASDVSDAWVSELRRINSLKAIMSKVYDLSLDDPQKLNNYEGFSEEVYGEFNFDIVSDIVQKVPVTEADTFMDLGSGVGQVVLQCAAQANCKLSVGIEKRDIPHDYALKMGVHFKRIMNEQNMPYGDYKLLQGDFLEPGNRKWIDRSTIIFVNNYAFPSTVNHSLKQIFMELKQDTIIVSSASFCPLNFRLSERTLDDLGAILSVRQIKFQGEGVSWTNKHIDYFIHRIDRTKLEKWYEDKNKALLAHTPRATPAQSSDSDSSDAEWEPSDSDKSGEDSPEVIRRKRKYSYSSGEENIPSSEDDGIEKGRRTDLNKEKLKEKRREYEKRRRLNAKVDRRSQSDTPVSGESRCCSRSVSPTRYNKRIKSHPGPSSLGKSDSISKNDRTRPDSSTITIRRLTITHKAKPENQASHSSLRRYDGTARKAPPPTTSNINHSSIPPTTSKSEPVANGGNSGAHREQSLGQVGQNSRVSSRKSSAVHHIEVATPTLSTDPIIQNFLLMRSEEINDFFPSYSAQHQFDSKDVKRRQLERKNRSLEDEVTAYRTSNHTLIRSKMDAVLGPGKSTLDSQVRAAMKLIANHYYATQRINTLTTDIKGFKAALRADPSDEQRRRQKRLVKLLKSTFNFVGLDVKRKWADRFDKLDATDEEEASAKLQADFKAAIKQNGFLRDK